MYVQLSLHPHITLNVQVPETADQRWFTDLAAYGHILSDRCKNASPSTLAALIVTLARNHNPAIPASHDVREAAALYLDIRMTEWFRICAEL